MKRKLVALVGHAGAGKDTVASMMPAHRLAFAEPLKKFCAEVFGFSHGQVWGPFKNAPTLYQREDGQPLTPRWAMQRLGTEWGRACYPNIWAEYGVRRAIECLDGDEHAIAVLTDCRFVNEALAVRDAGGEVWRVVRAGLVMPPEVAAHPSEVEQDTPEMDALVTLTIRNDGTLNDLQNAVWSLLNLKGWSDV